MAISKVVVQQMTSGKGAMGADGGESLKVESRPHSASLEARAGSLGPRRTSLPVLELESGGEVHPGAGKADAAATLAQRGRLALLSMLLLVLQGTALAVALRQSRLRGGPGQRAPYLASVSVAVTEAIKLAICVSVELRKCQAAAAAAGEPFAKHASRVAGELVAASLPMLLPAGMFVMQQVLLIIAATHLDAVAFQIFSQSFKLVPTAVFARWLLGQRLEPVQWASIPVLTAGVVAVTLDNGARAAAAGAGGGAAARAAAAAGAAAWYLGMVACSVSGLSSAYAGVYFERYVKGKHAASVWHRNIQLGIYGVPLSIAYALAKDGPAIRARGALQARAACLRSGGGGGGGGAAAARRRRGARSARPAAARAALARASSRAAGARSPCGSRERLTDRPTANRRRLLQGFNRVAWLVIALQIAGGLLYCDNILKNFALAISVILTVLVAIPLFGQVGGRGLSEGGRREGRAAALLAGPPPESRRPASPRSTGVSHLPPPQWPSAWFLCGVALVLLSVFMYGKALSLPSAAQLERAQAAAARALGCGGGDGHAGGGAASTRCRLLVAVAATAVVGVAVTGLWLALPYGGGVLPGQAAAIHRMGATLKEGALQPNLTRTGHRIDRRLLWPRGR
eukprot:scaffold17.g565.t1